MVFCTYIHILRTQYTFTRYIDFTKKKIIYKSSKYLPNTKFTEEKSTIGTFTSGKKNCLQYMSFYYESLFNNTMVLRVHSVFI